ncbi:MAG: nickel pincer cofactor biosynthesis protein LarC [Gammaproteobacteria bacterium]|nr:nickel pincer cofactor biosynthesis protein LarC [Gammaproteobacteria bacterium]MYI78246.1 nickel pincer cofactor biosynthesis protein LarC [Gammaproteobacteria bacterium]
MPALLYECFSGIAGNMNLGALIDLGVPPDYLRAELSRLGMDREFELSIARAKSKGIAGTLVRVTCESSDKVRNLHHIKEIINNSPYSDRIKSSAIRTFELLAEAEATVHDTDISNVHFHEVGAVDAIVDIVGSAIAMEYLQPSEVYCGPVELGSGTADSEHGTLPVPAPATLQLLLNKPTTRGNVPFEATTPTGAAILCNYVDSFEIPASFNTTRVGYGLGEKTSSRPNAVRVTIGELRESIKRSENMEIECNVDDMNPEAYEYLIDQLFTLGAVDVFLTPIIMKKSRPANKLTVLVPSNSEGKIVREILRSTTTSGVRMHTVRKQILSREVQSISTSLGKVRVKTVQLPEGATRWKLEHDDVLYIAKENELSYLEVKRIIEREVNDKISNDE